MEIYYKQFKNYCTNLFYSIGFNQEDNLRSNAKIMEQICLKYGMALQFGSKQIKNNKRIAKIAIAQNPLAIQFCTQILKEDLEIINLSFSCIQDIKPLQNNFQFNLPLIALHALKINKDSYYLISDKLQEDIDFQLSAIEYCDSAFLNYMKIVKEIQKERLITLLKINGSIYKYIYLILKLNDKNNIILDDKPFYQKAAQINQLLNDEELLIAALTNYPSALKYASDSLKDNEEIIKIAVQKDGSLLSLASERLQQDQSLIKLALANDEFSKQYYERNQNLIDSLAQNIKRIGSQIGKSIGIILDDFDEVQLAISKNPNAIQNVEKNFKDNEILIFQCLKKNGLLLQYASDRLKDNEDIVKIAIQQNGIALWHASKRIKDLDEIVTLAIEDNGQAFHFASERLQGQKELCIKAMQNCDQNFNFNRIQNHLQALPEIIQTAIDNKIKILDSIYDKKFILKQTEKILEYDYRMIQHLDEDQMNDFGYLKMLIQKFPLGIKYVKCKDHIFNKLSRVAYQQNPYIVFLKRDFNKFYGFNGNYQIYQVFDELQIQFGEFFLLLLKEKEIESPKVKQRSCATFQTNCLIQLKKAQNHILDQEQDTLDLNTIYRGKRPLPQIEEIRDILCVYKFI